MRRKKKGRVDKVGYLCGELEKAETWASVFAALFNPTEPRGWDMTAVELASF